MKILIFLAIAFPCLAQDKVLVQALSDRMIFNDSTIVVKTRITVTTKFLYIGQRNVLTMNVDHIVNSNGKVLVLANDASIIIRDSDTRITMSHNNQLVKIVFLHKQKNDGKYFYLNYYAL